jgi:hypothetical protein
MDQEPWLEDGTRLTRHRQIDEEIKLWIVEAAERGTRLQEDAMNIHIDELDARLRDPAHWEEGILECLRSAERLSTELCIPYEVTVGLPIGRPVEKQDLHDPSLDKLLTLRVRTPPMLCLFRAGREPWEVTVQDFGGRCEHASLPGLDMYPCDWWDEYDELRIGCVWLRSARHNSAE